VTGDEPRTGGPADIARFCRQVEEHLTRVNEGHLVRIVGQAFELVRGWALEGIPLSVVCRGITLKAERHRAGRSTRPLRLEFCEADVRAEYDSWRRAVGVAAATTTGDLPDASPPAERRRPSLARELGRAVDRLTSVAGRLDLSDRVRETLSSVLEELIALREEAKSARGAARDRLQPSLVALDRRLLTAARVAAGSAVVEELRQDASRDLEPYRARLTPEAWVRSVERGTNRLLRDRLALPVLDADA
jgi:hypothetical protein